MVIIKIIIMLLKKLLFQTKIIIIITLQGDIHTVGKYYIILYRI